MQPVLHFVKLRTPHDSSTLTTRFLRGSGEVVISYPVSAKPVVHRRDPSESDEDALIADQRTIVASIPSPARTNAVAKSSHLRRTGPT